MDRIRFAWIEFLFLTGATLFCTAPLRAQAQAEAVFLDAPPNIDGRLDDFCYEDARPHSGFTQYHPVNGEVAPFQTFIYVFFTRDTLYVGFDCRDPEPGKIQADITPFGEYEKNDEAAILLDCFSDQRNYETFAVNARGVKSGKETVWKAASAISSDGWSAEFAIPFASLRFPVRERQEWRVNFRRYIFRLDETDFWAPVGRNQMHILAKTFAPLTGISGIRGGRRIDIFPYIGGRRSASEGTTENKFAYGLDLKWGITSNLTLDLTTSPDYSEVESDPFFYQISPYEVYLTEKRPFYSEGESFFQSYFPLFYSRRITNPLVAFKLTGKEWGTSVGLLCARDTPEGDASHFHTALRLKKDIMQISYAGLIYSGTEAGDGGWNRNIGADVLLRLKNDYTILAMAARSFDSNQQHNGKGMYYFNFSRRADPGLSYAVYYHHVDPGTDVSSGYVSNNDIQIFTLYSRYNFRWQEKWLQNLTVSLEKKWTRSIEREWMVQDSWETAADFLTADQWQAHLSLFSGSVRERTISEEKSLEWQPESFRKTGGELGLSYSGNPHIQTGIGASLYSGPVFNDTLTRVTAGSAREASLWLNWKLTPQFQWRFSAGVVDQEPRDESFRFRGTICSTSASWQLTRTLSTGAHLQYDTRLDRFQYDFLCIYEPANVSRMTLSLKNYAEGDIRFFHPSATSLALKLSYLFRI